MQWRIFHQDRRSQQWRSSKNSSGTRSPPPSRSSKGRINELKEDIKLHGQREPILYYEDEEGREIGLDGRNREKALKTLKMEPRYKKLHLAASASPVSIIASLNLKRRHLTESQRAALGAKMLPFLEKEAKARQGRKKSEEERKKSNEGAKGETARAQAAKASGSSPRTVQDAKWLEKNDPARFKEVESGTKKLNTAIQEVKQEQQTKDLRGKAQAAKKATKLATSPTRLWRVLPGDVIAEISKLGNGAIDCVITDPPRNVGNDYGAGITDKMDHAQYINWQAEWLEQCRRVLAIAGSICVFSDDWNVAKLYLTLHSLKFHPRAWVKLHYPPAQPPKKSFNSASRHLLWFTKSEQRYTFNPPANAPSDDVWVCAKPPAREKVHGYPDQLEIATLVQLIACVTEPNQHILDPFCGTGSTGVAAMMGPIGPRRFTGIEKAVKWAEIAAAKIHEAAQEHGDDADDADAEKPAPKSKKPKKVADEEDWNSI